jgi:hypothetical protein
MTPTVTIYAATNGFIVRLVEKYDDIDVDAEFVALSLDEALEIVRECYEEYVSEGLDISNIVDETIPKN